MNYYNPYFNAYPYYGITNIGADISSRSGLFSRLFGGLNFSKVLSGTQKTLNIANQAIPLIKQAQPMMRNAKTMFKVMNEFKKVDTPNVNKMNNLSNSRNLSNSDILPDSGSSSSDINNNYGPTFFA